jgi:predicted TPR repeat methyltransferase
LAIADIFSQELDAVSAVETYQNIAASSPEFSRDAHVKIAEVYKKSADFTKAVEAYKQALTAKKNQSKLPDVEVQFMIADALELNNQTEKAIEEYLKIPYLYEKQLDWTVKAYLRIARIFEDHENWNQAVLTYNKILKYDTEERVFAQERLDWIKANTSVDVTQLQ